MAIGTAGYTAMLCVLALERHGVQPGDGEVLVTGATGGVGSVAIALLAKLGHTVVAATGRATEEAYLKALGASRVLDRAEFAAAGKPLQKERWAAAVDAVGSHTLANVLAQLRYGGVAAACGLAQGMDLPANMAPFILRGVTLRGIDSVMAPLASRQAAWHRLAIDLDAEAARIDDNRDPARRCDCQSGRVDERQSARAACGAHPAVTTRRWVVAGDWRMITSPLARPAICQPHAVGRADRASENPSHTPCAPSPGLRRTASDRHTPYRHCKK